MRKSRLVNNGLFGQRLLLDIVQEYNRQLVAYAKDTIQEIGAKIKTYHRANNMDRTGNLLNSLCWGVAYNGKVVGSGFYQEAAERGESFLHEREPDYMYAFPVHGHDLAARYISRYGAAGSTGRWRVFFAILAPYWGYWENGFNMVYGGQRNGKIPRMTKFLRFAVMSEFYDKVSNDLRPAKTNFKVNVETYVKSYNIGNYRVPSSLEKTWLSRVDRPQYSRRRRK